MSSSRGFVFYLIVALYCITQGHGAFYPTGCAYDTTDASMGIYECDYSLITLPIYYSNFSDPVPQRFVLYNVEGTLPSNGTFDEFTTFNQSAITSDYTCYLEISCVDGGNLTLETGTFFGMNYVQEFKISSCKINSLPSGVFSDFMELDHLHIEGGSIVSTSSDSLSGLSLTKLSNVPFPKGRLTIRDTNVNGNLSAGFFGSLTSVRAIDLTNSGIVTLFDTMFANNTQLRYLSLGNNGFTTIPTTLFGGLHGLTEVDFTGIAWDCSCSNLWFLDQFSSNYMRIVGGALCNSPSDYQAATFPSGCSYEQYRKAVGRYNCGFSAASFPLSLSSFSNPNPQRLKISNVTGSFSNIFSGFSSYDTATLNSGFKASLEISCATGGTLTISASSFADLGYLQELRIVNCDITSGLPDNVFTALGNMDFLEIEGGIIRSTTANSLTGLNIVKLSNIPNPIGGLSFKNTVFTNGNISSGFFDSQVNAQYIALDNAGISTLYSSMFSQNVALRTLNLARNDFTTLPSNIFEGLDSLLSVNLSVISWECTCTNLWFTQWLSSNYIGMVGSILCDTPSLYQNDKWSRYYYTVCEITDFCYGVPGIVVDTTCYQWHQLFAYFMLLVAFALAGIALFILCNVRRKMLQTQRQIEAKRRKTYIKIKEALLRGRTGQMAPAATMVPMFTKREPSPPAYTEDAKLD